MKSSTGTMLVTEPGDYRTRDGRRVTIHEIKPYNSAGQRVTFPLKGSVWKLFRGKERPRGLAIWRANGQHGLGRYSGLDIVGPWMGDT